jgi:hypothetical protein
VKEAAQVGFRRCIAPIGSYPSSDAPSGSEVVAVLDLAEALDQLLE